MKKIITFFLFGILLFSCSEDEIPNNNTEFQNEEITNSTFQKDLFPNADWSLESAVTKPGEDGCVIVETRLYLSYAVGSGQRVLMAISRDKICPGEIRVNSVEIGSCVDGYYSNVYIENFKSDDLECLTVLLENDEVRKLYDQHLEDIKSTL